MKRSISSDKVSLPFLAAVCNAKPVDRIELLKGISDDSVHKLCEAIYNINYAKLPMTALKKSKLKKCYLENKRDFDCVMNKNVPLKAKRKRLIKLEKELIGAIKTSLPHLKNICANHEEKKLQKRSSDNGNGNDASL